MSGRPSQRPSWPSQRSLPPLTQAFVAEKQSEMITAGIYGDVEGPDDKQEEWARYFGAILGEPTGELYRKSVALNKPIAKWHPDTSKRMTSVNGSIVHNFVKLNLDSLGLVNSPPPSSCEP